MKKRKIIEIINGEQKSLKELGLVGNEIKAVWYCYDLEKMWASNSFNPMTGKPIIKGEQESLEGLILQHEMGVLIEDIAHDWSVTSNDYFRYYSRYVGMGKTAKVLIEYI